MLSLVCLPGSPQAGLSQAVRHENGPLLGVVEPIPWSVYGTKPDAVFGSLLSLTEPSSSCLNAFSLLRVNKRSFEI